MTSHAPVSSTMCTRAPAATRRSPVNHDFARNLVRDYLVSRHYEVNDSYSEKATVMSSGNFDATVRYLRRSAGLLEAASLTDRKLLTLYHSCRDESAFYALV